MIVKTEKIIMKTEVDIYVANQVRAIRRSKHVSQSLLSFGIGVSKGFVGQVESESQPAKYNINHLYEIALFLDCSMLEFFPKGRLEKRSKGFALQYNCVKRESRAQDFGNSQFYRNFVIVTMLKATTIFG